jgi:short-subunit dehydrogenase
MDKKVILITGASSGLGREMAKKALSSGYTVYGTTRSKPSSPTLDGFYLIQLDVNSSESIKNGLEKIIEVEGKLDVLINSAGISLAGPLEHCSLKQAQDLFNTNVIGLFDMCRQSLPYLRETHGNIINISSLAGIIALPYRSLYSASKFAVEGLTESLSMEVSQFGVKVSVISPGDLKTNINQNRAEAMLPDESPYKDLFQQHIEEIKSEMDQSMDPDVIGELALKILKSNKPKLRYLIGNNIQKASTIFKRILPARIFEGLIKSHFNLK